MRHLHRTVTVLLVLSLMVSLGLVATATKASAWTLSQKREVYKNKPTSAVLHHHSSKPKLTQQVSRAGYPIYCTNTYESVTAVNHLGMHVYEFGARAHFCYDGYSVTSVRWQSSYGTTVWWTNWEWVQADDYVQAKGGGINQSYVYRRWAGHMRICMFWYCTNRYPWVSLTLHADGTSPGNGSLG